MFLKKTMKSMMTGFNSKHIISINGAHELYNIHIKKEKNTSLGTGITMITGFHYFAKLLGREKLYLSITLGHYSTILRGMGG